jgi:transglutaminase-like putative cysteine protease
MFSEGYPQDKQISYAGLLWLLGAQLVVMAPLVFYLPIWLLPIVLFSAGWRIRVMKGYQEQPGKITKIIIAIFGLVALAFSGMQTVSLDMMASLLMLGFAYKALEVIERRDAMVVILTGFLLIGVLFLYSQSMLSALYGAFALVVLTGAMIAIQQSKSDPIISNIKLAFAMLMLCLPLMLLFFLVSPRFAPLWSIPLQAGHAKTGISDSMSPGDIAELSKSDELAFTATFKGKVPEQKDLYWRGLVLQNFDGKTWTQFAEKLDKAESKIRLQVDQQQLQKSIIKRGETKEYEVIYEKTAQPWLFSLSPVVDIKGDAIYGSDFRVMAKQNILSPMMLKLTSYPDSLREVNLPEATRQSALQLPNDKNSNPQSFALARRLLAESSSKQDFINKVMNRYRQQEYYYTLRPTPLGNTNTIDNFLINTKKGFCEHYASSFVFLMRAAGVPARIVTGYQGGTWNEKGKFLSIRQYDAHAWTEVWLENSGWIRLDPTSMVAPSRIEKNLEEAVADEGTFLEGKLFALSKYSWLSSLQNKLDSTQYAWRKFVLGYDNDTQASFLKSIFGELSMQKMATIVGGFFMGIIVFWSLFLGLGRKRSTEAVEHQLYRRFCRLLDKYGVKRESSQTPSEFSKLASAHLPKASTEINAFSKLYSEICYNPDIQSKRQENIATLRRLLRQVKASV